MSAHTCRHLAYKVMYSIWCYIGIDLLLCIAASFVLFMIGRCTSCITFEWQSFAPESLQQDTCVPIHEGEAYSIATTFRTGAVYFACL